MSDANLAELILKNTELTYQLTDVPCGIGRSVKNTIVLQSERVSRQHAMVQRDESGKYTVIDLGSQNGTYLNGRRLRGPATLHDHDVLAIGEFALVFSNTASAVKSAGMPTHMETLLAMTAQEVTVLVVDIRDFTALARQLGEIRTAELMGAFNQACGTALERTKTWAVKFIGDAVMAVWDHALHGSAVAVMSHVLQAIAEIQTLAEGLQQRFELSQPLRVGAGINTGVASIGNIGSGATPDYTALGDVVNKAFRLEASTRSLGDDLAFGDEVMEIVGCAAVAALARAHRVELKGYSEECPVYSMPVSRVVDLLKLMDAGRRP